MPTRSTPTSARSGSIALIAVLITGAVGLTIGLSMSLRGLSELERGFASHQSMESLALAEGCAEDVLLELASTGTAAGRSLALGDGSCTVSVTGSGDTRTITVTGTVESWSRQVTVDVSLAGSATSVTKWRETAD